MMRPSSLFCASGFLLLSIIEHTSGQALATWYTTSGTQVVMQNATTGGLVYNIDSAEGFSGMSPLDLTIPMKRGSPLASTGYAGGAGNIYGQVFYQGTANQLVQLIIKCAYSTGLCGNYGNYNISNNVTTPISNHTGLAATLSSANVGYRVTYEDVNGVVRQISYANSNSTVFNWADGVPVGNASVNGGWGLASYATADGNQTLYSVAEVPSGHRVQGYSQIRATGEWTTSVNSLGLPGWDINNSTFAAVFYNNLSSIFYIDPYSAVQWAQQDDLAETGWTTQPPQAESIWPRADQPNAHIAAATSVNITDNSLTLYYVSTGGRIVQAKMTNSSWQPAQLVQPPVKPNITLIGNQTTLSPDSERSQALKLGLSIGISFCVVVLGVITLYLMHRKRTLLRRARDDFEARQAELNKVDSLDSDVIIGGKAELSGLPKQLWELDHDPDCQLRNQLALGREFEVGAEIPVEMVGCTCACAVATQECCTRAEMEGLGSLEMEGEKAAWELSGRSRDAESEKVAWELSGRSCEIRRGGENGYDDDDCRTGDEEKRGLQVDSGKIEDDDVSKDIDERDEPRYKGLQVCVSDNREQARDPLDDIVSPL